MESETCDADKALTQDSSLDWSEVPRYFGSSHFNGFGNDEQIPGRLVIKSVEFDGEEEEQEK